MRLTPKAEALRPRLKDALAGVLDVLAPPEVPLVALRQTVRLLMADSRAGLLLEPMLTALSRSAPGLDLVVQPWHGAAAALEALTRGTMDLAASVFGAVGGDIRREELLHESYVVAMRRERPAAAGFGRDRWLAFPHVLVSGRGEVRGALDEALARHGRMRTCAMWPQPCGRSPPVRTWSDDPPGRGDHDTSCALSALPFITGTLRLRCECRIGRTSWRRAAGTRSYRRYAWCFCSGRGVQEGRYGGNEAGRQRRVGPVVERDVAGSVGRGVTQHVVHVGQQVELRARKRAGEAVRVV